MKRFIGLLLALMMFLIFLPVISPEARAAEDSSVFQYTTDDEGNAAITGYSGIASSVVIPATVDGYPVTSIAALAFQRDVMTSVSIPEGVTVIESNAFYDCANLTTVSLPKTLTTIGMQAFENCISLLRVDIPENVAKIGHWAFYGCDSLSEVSLPAGLQKIGYAAFYNCDALTEINIPKNVTVDTTHVNNRAPSGPFLNCSNLNTIVFEDGITVIPDMLFWGLTGLQEVTIPDTVTSVGAQAFRDCSNLKKINLPKNLTTIEAQAFEKCTSLEGIDFPGTLTEIQYKAFLDCTGLREISLPDSMKTLGYGVFQNCSSLQKVRISKNVVTGIHSGSNFSTEAGPFTGCSSLSTVEFATGITVLPNGLLHGVTGLKEITLPNTITAINVRTFKDCTNLTKINLSSNLLEIKDYAFENCTKLNSVVFPNKLESINARAFKDCSGMTEAILPDSLTTLKYGAFLNCTALQKLYIPRNMKTEAYAGMNTSTEIGPFYGCGSLSTVQFGEGITAVPNGLFHGVTGLKEVELPKTVTSIGNRTFRACTNLAKIKMPRGLTAIGTDALTTPSTTVIHAASGTYAETWASENGFQFVIDDSVDAPVIKAGNVASTGKIKISWEKVDGAAKYEVYRSATKDGTYTRISTVTGTSLINAKAEPEELYYYKVKAVSAGGTKSEFSNNVYRTCDLPSPAITLSNVASTGKIKISWDKIEGAAKYEVYRCATKSGTYTRISTTTGTSVTNAKAEAGELYYYKVRALHANSAANSAYSGIASRTCDLPSPAITLSNVASTGKIKISWDKIEGAAKYEVYRCATKSGTYTRISTTTGTSVINAKAEPGELYYYKVRALHTNANATSAYSGIASRTCDLPSPVVKVSNVASTGKPKVTWETVEGAEKYEVYRATSESGTYTRISTTTGTSVTNAKAEAGELYYYKVRALHANSAANSAYSGIVSRTCDLPRPTITLDWAGSGKPRISWAAVDGAVKYELYWSTNNQDFTKLITTTSTRIVNNKAVAGTKYYYKVRALHANSAANSAYSAVKYITSK